LRKSSLRERAGLAKEMKKAFAKLFKKKLEIW
jgi:hypothetical protein